MPLPIAAGAAIAAWGSATYLALSSLIPESVKKISKAELERLIAGDVSELEDAAIMGAFEKLGLTIDPKDGINERTITNAINAGPLGGSGIELTNVFNKESLKQDLIKIALAEATNALGLDKGLSVEHAKEQIKSLVSKELMEQVRAGEGEWADKAKDVAEIVRQIQAYKIAKQNHEQIGQNLDMSKEGISNRERQAKYRASHTRVWQER